MKRRTLSYLRDILGNMREKLIHDYLGVDANIVWLTVTDRVPALRPFIERADGGLENASSTTGTTPEDGDGTRPAPAAGSAG